MMILRDFGKTALGNILAKSCYIIAIYSFIRVENRN